MTVVYLPDYTDRNPYQSNLVRAVSSAGESVELSDEEGVFRLYSSVRSRDDVSVVHIHWLHPYIFAGTGPRTVVKMVLTMLQLLLIRRRGVSVVWTAHNVVAHGSEYPRLERLFRHLFVRSRICDRVFVHCEAMSDHLVEAYALPERVKRKVVVVPHGHYIDNYENEIGRVEARAALDIDPSETVFLFFGQIRPYKGVSSLIEAFESVAGDDSRLLIAGSVIDDEMEERLDAARSDDRIATHLGFVPDDEIQRYMNAADVVVLPFRKVATSGSAVLAMSFGKALIVPALGCLPELVDEEGTVTYDPDDPEGLSDALRTIEGRDTAEMGRRNYALAERNTWEMIAERTVAVYRELV